MTEPTESIPALLFCGVLTSSEKLIEALETKLAGKYGPIETESKLMDFDSTDYYEKEMGKCLKRKFYAFENLVEQDKLTRIKLISNEIEKSFKGSIRVHRPVNIDPGLLLPSKIILASFKDFSHRIYLGGGVYGEITLQYRNGAFTILPWTFPDFRKETYHSFFLDVRSRYMEKLRSHRKGPSPSTDISDHE